MPQHFAISAASATKEEWGWLVVLGNIEAMDGSPYLMVQMAHEFTADDLRLGQDKPYIEINNQGWSWYGHISSFQLQRDRVLVQMDSKAQERMENDGSFSFSFELTVKNLDEIQTALGRIFQGYSFYAQQSA